MPIFLVPIGNGLHAAMRGDMITRDADLGARKARFLIPTYYERADTENCLLIPQPCIDSPMSFHACVTLCSRLLPLMHSTPQVYDDGEDFTINPRQLIQSSALQYGVDPNEMTSHYTKVRSLLGHRELIHPPTIEVGLTNLQIRAKSSTTIKRFH